ncbi:MAG TPA: SIMPL domain-containing protein [Planctomycetaceae bacterium]|nr:SIMPL domain-containing protein [Planctomycetaceae bacterium]
MRTISVAGTGKVSAPPDMASIQTGVITQAETARDALAANNEAMAKILAVLKQHKIADKDVQTASFQVHPVYRHDRQGQTEPQVVGYRVQNQVRVDVRNLPELGKVLDALVEAGSNQVSGITFGVDDPTGSLNQARGRAMADAKSRAQVYAQAAGVTVGRVQSISEQPPQIPRPMPMQMAFARADAASVPVATGEQEFAVTVYVEYKLEDAE